MDKFGNKFGTSFQIKIISSLLSDRIFLQQMYDILKPEMFDSDANEWIVTKTLSHFDDFQQLPTLDVFKNEVDKVERDVLKQSIVDNLKQVWNGLESNSGRIAGSLSRNRRRNCGGWHRPGTAELGGFWGDSGACRSPPFP